jgi:hypothetical protein
MTNLITQSILSMLMKKSYQDQHNIKYCISANHQQFATSELANMLSTNQVRKFIPELNIDELCGLEYNREFNVRAEGEFFIKSANYDGTLALKNAINLAIEDDIRFQLYYNHTTIENCPRLEETLNFLKLDQQQFYNSFIYNGISINELYTQQRPDLDTPEHLKEKLIAKQLKATNNGKFSNIKPEVSSWVENKLQAIISQNANVKLEKTNDCVNSDIVIWPGLDKSSKGGETTVYKDNIITKNILSVPIPMNELANDWRIWNEFLHGIAHFSLDHPCEDGFYGCNAKDLKQEIKNFDLLTVMSGNNPLHLQSLLPWDIAALRHIYGMPEAKDATYKLSSSSSLENAFGYEIKDTALITFSSTGNNSIDASDIAEYAIDLNYDHLSNITNSDINFSFLLSYDTEISQVILNKAGSLDLNNNFKTNIILLPGCYDIVLHNDHYQNNDIININQNCKDEELEQIDIYNFNPSQHELTIPKEIADFEM